MQRLTSLPVPPALTVATSKKPRKAIPGQREMLLPISGSGKRAKEEAKQEPKKAQKPARAPTRSKKAG